MQFKEMINRSKLYNKMLEVMAKKPKLIAKYKQEIEELKKEIEVLESEKKNQILSKVNPKKLFFKKAQPADISEEIQKKEIKLRILEKEIETLESFKTKDLIDVDEVINDCASILNKKSTSIDKMNDEIIQAREKYFALVDRYNQELRYHNQYSVTVRKTLEKVLNEDFQPKYMGDSPKQIGHLLGGKNMADELIQGHRRNIHDITTECNNVGLFKN